MKKKGFLFIVLFLILLTPFIFAATNDTSESQKVEQARTCLEEKIDDKECSKLGFEEKVFSVLSIGECEDELLEDSKNEECWPASGCTVKATAQALIALENSGEDTDHAEAWLLDQTTSPSEITWYLQIESSKETKCVISYLGKDYDITINKEKQINSGAGSCLSLSEGKWWLRISPSCYGEELEVSCDQNFLTNLLFKKQDSATIHVSEKTTGSSANGLSTEKVESFCFGQNQKCDYEGSLWAAMALDYTGNNVDDYLPYLITLSEATANAEFIPESFLYYLTGSSDFKSSLLSKQKINKYWEESGDRFYDTALALLPIKDDISQKINSKAWLLDNKTRDSDGCWKGSISATGFILYSLWPTAHTHKGSGGTGGTGGNKTTIPNCLDKSGFCISSVSCREADGIELTSYDCIPALTICCNKNEILDSCWGQGGEICNLGETCQVGTTSSASDLELEETCCIDGYCMIPLAQSDCLVAEGSCKMECSGEEEPITQACDNYADICCVTKTTKKNYVWIWILSLGILIILVGIGFLYRDKLKAYWIAKFGKGRSSPPNRGGPFFPPAFPSFPPRGIPPRRMVPPSTMPVRPMPMRKPQGEMEDVLKKLKEMGK